MGDAELVARGEVVGRKLHAAEPVGRLDDGRRQAHLDVPLDVAVEQPDARVVGLEAQHRERVRHDGHRVAHRRRRRVVDVPGRPVARPRARAVEHLEVVAVQVERVRGIIDVVDDDLHDIAVFNDEGVDLAVDDGVGVEVAGGRRAVQGGDLLADVGEVVEAGAVACVSAPTSRHSRGDTYRGYPFWSKQNLKSSTINLSYWLEEDLVRGGAPL